MNSDDRKRTKTYSLRPVISDRVKQQADEEKRSASNMLEIIIGQYFAFRHNENLEDLTEASEQVVSTSAR